MPRLFVIFVPIIILVLAVSACEDGGPAASPSARVSPTAKPSPTAEATLTPQPSAGAIKVSPVENARDFLDHYKGKELTREECTFDAAAKQVGCGENGLFQPDLVPSLEAWCSVLLAEDKPIAVRCEYSNPLTVVYYAVP